MKEEGRAWKASRAKGVRVVASQGKSIAPGIESPRVEKASWESEGKKKKEKAEARGEPSMCEL